MYGYLILLIIVVAFLIYVFARKEDVILIDASNDDDDDDDSSNTSGKTTGDDEPIYASSAGGNDDDSSTPVYSNSSTGSPSASSSSSASSSTSSGCGSCVSHFTPWPTYKELPQETAWNPHDDTSIYDRKWDNTKEGNIALGGILPDDMFPSAKGAMTLPGSKLPPGYKSTSDYTKSIKLLKDRQEIIDRQAWILSQTTSTANRAQAISNVMNGTQNEKIRRDQNTTGITDMRYFDMATPNGTNEGMYPADVHTGWPQGGALLDGQPSQNIQQLGEFDVRKMVKGISKFTPAPETHKSRVEAALSSIQTPTKMEQHLPMASKRSGFKSKDDSLYREDTVWAQHRESVNGYAVDAKGEIITAGALVAIPPDPQVGKINPRATFAVEAERQRRAALYTPFTRPDNTGFYDDFIVPDPYWNDISDVQQLI
jgi:hypothetical protein